MLNYRQAVLGGAVASEERSGVVSCTIRGKQTLETTRYWVFHIGVCACLLSMSSNTQAQTVTGIYTLDNVWLLPDITRPGEPPRQMTGTFDWVYQAGDFENGSGQFTDLFVPWFNPGIGALNINVDLTSIEFTLPGNFHDLGVDITLFTLDPLAPGQSSAIDLTMSMFEIQQGIIYQGHVISGSILHVPQTVLAGDLNADGFVGVDDLNIVLVNWNQTVTPGDLLLGDPTDEGFVGVDDLNVLLANWNAGTLPPSEALALVPEPASWAVLACGAELLRRRRPALS